MRKGIAFCIIIIVSFFLSCHNADKMHGKYVCKKHFSKNLIDNLSIRFRENGTMVLEPYNYEGTYEIRGDSVIITAKVYNPCKAFKIDGNRIHSECRLGKIEYVKK